MQNYFNELGLFKNLEKDELELFISLFEEKCYLKGNALFIENTPRVGFMIIRSGTVELYKDVNNKSKKLITLNSGNLLGEGIFLEEEVPHSASAYALDDVVVMMISIENIKTLSEKHPSIYVKTLKHIAKIISQRLRNANAHIMRDNAVYLSGDFRVEHDLLGERDVPNNALFGIQTLRAIENFPITHIPIAHYPQLINALAYIKKAAAMANNDLKLLEKDKLKAISQACDEILMGQHISHFVVDMIQGGAGTSTNMNANEVIANRALEILGRKKGDYDYLHPNTDVNMAQSTNDVYPSAIRLGIILSYKKVKKAMSRLSLALLRKAEEFQDVIKIGRTQLQDAVPMTLGQEFRAWGHMVEEGISDLDHVIKNKITFLNLGGTAIGTGLNADPGYRNLVIIYLRELTGITELRSAEDLIQATQDTSHFVAYSSVLKNIALKLSKIANDLRLLSSGPRAGFNEINLPPMQPGSTIMPGKVNPVIPEVVNQVAFQVIGNDITVNLASEAGQLELNAMEPVIAFNLFQSQDILINAMDTFTTRAIEKITANREYCRKQVENSITLVTALNPYIGYENSTEVAKIALKENRSVYDIILEKKILDKEKLDKLMQPEQLIKSSKKFF